MFAETVTTSAGERISLEASSSLHILVDGERRFSLPRPSCGHGGHAFVLSAGERYLALFLYSGQNDLHYEVFEFGSPLRLVACRQGFFGEGHPPVFSRDERLLAVTWSGNSALDVQEEGEFDEEGRLVSDALVPWAHVEVLSLPSGDARSCRIDARVPAGFEGPAGSGWIPSGLAVEPDRLRFDTGWGTTIRLGLPLAESVTVDGPPGLEKE